MRFILFMLPGLPAEAADEDWTPPLEVVEAMTRYNRSMQEAGILLDLNGLHSPGEAVRVTFPAGRPQVTDGPFTEAREMVGGYWIIDVKSREEAVEWAKRCPIGGEGPAIEVRQIFEMSEFPAELQEAARL